ncbi:hypothetical protein PIB30_018553 [Stylosanthes scabra]|uniref:Uncharacterized protein n=1 Tax=Stylosanthes scabra TaxID=79078 RepID=A0ABU6Q7S5_9FABA|nr:hypothetical protein [Stylosanthes scabra]
MRERKCSFRGEALGKVRGLNPNKVEEAVLTQPSVVESDSLPEFRRNFPLMEDSGMEGDYVIEAAGRPIASPSERVRRAPLSVGIPGVVYSSEDVAPLL